VTMLRDRVPAGPGTGCPGYVRRFDGWAASYDRSPLQTVLYRPVQNATAAVPRRSRFAAAMAERLPFADAVFDLVVVTLSVSHWGDRAAGMAQIRVARFSTCLGQLFPCRI